MPDQPRHPWSVIETLGIAVIAISPFWFLAGDLSDLDEVKKTIAGGGMATISLAILKFGRRRRGDKPSTNKDGAPADSSGEQSQV